MISTKNGTIDLEVLEVEDIIDLDMLKRFLDNFALGMNCAAVAVNRAGNEITQPSYYRDFCENHIHKSSIGDRRCAECHNRMGEIAAERGEAYIGPCHAGLIDFAAPIMVNGVHIGTILGGQILDKAPDEKTIRKVAEEVDLDGERLWSAAQKIDILGSSNIKAAADVLFIVANTLARNGYSRIETDIATNSLAERFIQVSDTVKVLAISSQSIAENQQALTEQVQGIVDITEDISTVLKSVSQIADHIKLIGLNASIEAARLGSSGKGFAVIAREIQELSSKSKDTAVQVNDKTTAINTRINSTMKNAKATLTTTEQQSASMEELSVTVQEMVEIAKRFKTTG